MEKMQFKSFIFPHNPASIVVERPGRHAVFFRPGHGEVVQALGPGVKQVRCSGSFLAPTPPQAAALVAEFEEKSADSTPGILVLPGLGSMEAVLTELRWEAVGEGREVPYTMTFLQAEVSE
jgi:hypothetical protein